ncbi:Outer membrane protein OmpA [Rhizobium sp. NFR07]|nr:OmpA family protein [Rhizobium sp. NFR07]SFB39396.1 Outer membrane protein OmpA [Rhizobium sp. NFR07]
MSIKLRLFASVAAPVLALPMLMQPAYAIPPGIGTDPSLAMPGVIRVQQEIVPEEGQGGEEPRRKRQNAEQPEGGERPQRREQRAQEEGGGERPQRREQQAEQPQEQPRQREQQNAEQPEAERPQRREQRAQEEGGSEKPRRREQQAEQPQEQPRQREQQNAEQPEGERPRQREQRAQEDGGGEKPKRREQTAEQPKPVEKPAEQKADQAPEPKETESKQAEPKQAEPAQRQAEEPKPNPERQQNAEQPAEAQPQQRNAEQPQGERPRQREQQAGEGQGGERPRRAQQAQDGQPASGEAAPDQATSGGERRQQPAAQQQAEQPATLPVENGAAVLDSAKEQRPERARDGERQRRDPNRTGGQQPDAQQAQERAAPPPRTDADAQANDRITREQREQWRNQRRELTEERGERLDRRPDFERPRGWDLLGAITGGDREQGRDRGRDRDRDRNDGRVIISIDNQTIVRHDDSRRFYEDGRGPEYERLGDGRYREVVERSDGTRVVTIRNRYGEVVQRSRIVRGGEEYVLYYAPELLEDRGDDYTWRDPGEDLPPMRLGVPIDDYIIDTSSEPDRDYYQFLEQPPVERVERPYSLDEVRYSARIRDKVPRIDLDTITFATGSAEIPMNQATSLRKVADAINKVLEKDPSETFLIEGHTDAVGSDDSNLVLSDRRAESVAVVLSDAFGIPPENMTTQGYGERYLKVNTESANQENRRVTIRRITPLVKPVASNQ